MENGPRTPSLWSIFVVYNSKVFITFTSHALFGTQIVIESNVEGLFMGYLSKEQMKRVMWVSFFCILMIFLTAQFSFMRGAKNLEPIYLFNIGMDMVSMLMGYVLFVCFVIDVQKNGSDLRFLFLLLIVAYVGCFTDACAWIVDGVPSLRWANILDNTLYYMCAPIEACCFWLYTMTYLKLDDKYIRLIGKCIVLTLVVPILLRLINLFTGIYFTIDEAGIYHRSPRYAVSMIYAFTVMILALIGVIYQRKKLQRFQIVTFFVYAIAPIAIGVMTAFVYGLSPSASVVMLVVLLMYGVLNVNQGREKAAADRDLAVAAGIQENVLPKIFPFLPERKEFDIYATMNPAKEVGGDFYDFFLVDDDHIAMVMADVSGKGIPAALFMMVARTLIKNRALLGEEPAKVLHEVNNQLCEGNKAELFVTVWMAVISLSTGEGLAVNAGHEHPALRHKDGQYELVEYKHSPAVATMEDLNFRQHAFKLEPGDTFFVYTDGVTEATNASNELFGTKRMLEALNKNPDADPQTLLDNVSEDISSFVKEAKQFDDITMLAFQFNG